MDNNTNNIDLIRDYFNDTLDKQGQTSFEKRWDEDEEFATEIKVYLNTIKGLRQQRKKEAKEVVNTAHQAYLKTKKQRRIRRFIYAAAAVGLFFVISIGLIYSLTNTGSINYSAEVQSNSYENDGGTRGDGEDERVEEATTLFFQEEYGKALPLFKELLAQQEIDSVRGLFFIIPSFICENKADSSLVYLEKLNQPKFIKEKGSRTDLLVQYHYALSYMKKKDYPRAKEYLEDILKNDNPSLSNRRNNAQKLLDKINKITKSKE